MSNDPATRMLIAYALILLVVLAAAALLFWNHRNSRTQRGKRAQARLVERYRLRDEAAATASIADEQA